MREAAGMGVCSTESAGRCRRPWRAKRKRRRVADGAISDLALVCSLSGRGGIHQCFDGSDGAVVVLERVVGHALNVGLGDLVHFVEIAEEFAPVAITRLVDRELLG